MKFVRKIRGPEDGVRASSYPVYEFEDKYGLVHIFQEFLHAHPEYLELVMEHRKRKRREKLDQILK
jgi:hypothetical protein